MRAPDDGFQLLYSIVPPRQEVQDHERIGVSLIREGQPDGAVGAPDGIRTLPAGHQGHQGQEARSIACEGLAGKALPQPGHFEAPGIDLAAGQGHSVYQLVFGRAGREEVYDRGQDGPAELQLKPAVVEEAPFRHDGVVLALELDVAVVDLAAAAQLDDAVDPLLDLR